MRMGEETMAEPDRAEERARAMAVRLESLAAALRLIADEDPRRLDELTGPLEVSKARLAELDPLIRRFRQLAAQTTAVALNTTLEQARGGSVSPETLGQLLDEARRLSERAGLLASRLPAVVSQATAALESLAAALCPPDDRVASRSPQRLLAIARQLEQEARELGEDSEAALREGSR
jgi:hypothetical protein